MPNKTSEAIQWALKQIKKNGQKITLHDKHYLVDFVCKYFDENNVKYSTFNYYDLEPYLK